MRIAIDGKHVFDTKWGNVISIHLQPEERDELESMPNNHNVFSCYPSGTTKEELSANNRFFDGIDMPKFVKT